MNLDFNSFFDKIFANLDSVGIDYSDFQCDHVAFRALTNESYQKLKAELENLGILLEEVMIRKRPIAMFRLFKPLEYKGFIIPFFELMAPGKGDNYAEGLEHAEFVINGTLDEFKEEYPNLEFIFKDRKINPELVLKFSNNANVKFHLKNIEEIIKLQKEAGEL